MNIKKKRLIRFGTPPQAPIIKDGMEEFYNKNNIIEIFKCHQHLIKNIYISSGFYHNRKFKSTRLF